MPKLPPEICLAAASPAGGPAARNENPAAALRVGLLGAGKVAQALAPALRAVGHALAFVWSRTPGASAALATQLPSTPALSGPLLPSVPLPPADLYLLAVPDAAVPEVLQAAGWPVGAVVAHLAGALPLSVFEAAPVRGGVFYPLQSFSAGRVIEWAQVPLCVEAVDTKAEALLLHLAASLSRHVLPMSSAQRLRLHVAAVFANNFTNHLLGIAHALLHEAALPTSLLAPLVAETVAKAQAASPFTVQTGPAARRDEPTLAAHAAALAAHPRWLVVYEQLTASIQQQAATVANGPKP